MPSTVWKGTLSFGLVSFPVRLFSAARAETVHFRMLHAKDLSPVREVLYCATENRPLERSEIVKGYEVAKNEFIVIAAEDLKKIAPATATSMEIVQFVKNDEIDPLYFESSYYIAPETNSAKAYSLFVAALTETATYALASIAMHNREHIVVIRPSSAGLLLHTLFYRQELHTSNEPRGTDVKYSAKELELAKSLVSHLAAPFDPDAFRDTYRDNVLRLVDQKRKGQKVTPIKAAKKAPVSDLMEALQRSLRSVPAKAKPAAKAATKRSSAA